MSIEKIINFLDHLGIKIDNKISKDFVFANEEKENFKLNNVLNGLKSVSKNEENKQFIYNAFNKQIRNHNNLVNEIFISNGDNVKLEKTKTSITLERDEDLSKTLHEETREIDDSYKKSDF